jgi:hypothetical protein
MKSFKDFRYLASENLARLLRTLVSRAQMISEGQMDKA